MTLIDHDRLYHPPSMTAQLKWLIPVLSGLFVAVMFILASNNTKAMDRWQEVAGKRVFELQTEVQEGRTVRQIGILLLGAWGLVAAYVGRRRLRFNYLFLFPLLVFTGLAIGSVVWSHDRSFTAKRLIVFVCLAAAIVGFVRMFRLRDLPLFALIGCGLQILICIGFELAYNSSLSGKGGYRFAGTLHPNHAGIYSVVLMLAAVCLADRRRNFWPLVIAGAALVVLVLTKSRSSMIAGMMALVLYAVLRLKPVQLSVCLIGLAGSLAVFIILAAADVLPAQLSSIIYMGREDAAESKLTGRDMIWSAALNVSSFEWSRVITGFGYESFWTPAHARFVSDTVRFQISESHNAYLDLLLELGLVGALSYVVMIFGGVVAWSVLARRHGNPNHAFFAAICCFAIVHGLTESTTTDPTYISFFTFCSIALLAVRQPAWTKHRAEALS
jgi:exopolysaccharide production protein ExoQ